MSKLEPTRTYSNPTATDILRRMLDERGVEWHDTKIGKGFITVYEHDGITWIVTEHSSGRLSVKGCVKPTQGHYDGMTPEQAIAATLGTTYKPNPVWEKWHKSLRHETVETVGDAVEQLMYEAIEFGGDMGPNGNVCDGIDEGDVLTSGFINKWIARFESTLGRDRYSYEQLREISNAVGDAMEYAHDRAIEHPDRADPLWSLDEYVNRILKVAFEGEATLGATDAKPTQAESSGTCEADETDTWECVRDDLGGYGKMLTVHVMECTECGHVYEYVNGDYEYCPRCGRKRRDVEE